MTIAKGDVLLGKYSVEQVLGQGGMGVVVAARHLELGELFAIKLLLPQAIQNAEAVERFIREARASVRLKGEHVVKVHDVGRMEGGAPYMVMEHLAGTDLQGLLRTRGPLPVEEAVVYLLQVCEAVAEAHSLGVIHRDLKPANMFLLRLPNGAPCVKVIDFGISKQMLPGGEQALALTQAGTALGSPLYMSPEQMQGRPVDSRGDIWALGAVLYELLTGRPPFLAETLPQLAIKVLQEAPPPPSQLRPGIPPELDRIVLKCLEKRPEHRFQTATELTNDLGAAMGTTQRSSGGWAPSGAPLRPSLAVPAAPAVTGGTSAQTSDVVPAHPTTRSSAPAETGRSRAGLVLLLAVILGAGIGGVAFLLRPKAAPPAPAPVASAVEAPPPPTATTASKTTKSRKWWNDLPDEKATAPSARLPAPRATWLSLRSRAKALEEAQKYEEAQAAMREALDLARKQLSVDDAAFPETLQELARLTARTGKLEDAEKLLKEALEVLNKYGDPSEEGFDDTRQALVAVLIKQGKDEEARSFWKDGDPPLPPPKPTATPRVAPPPSAPRPPNPFEAWDRYKDKGQK